MNYHVLTLFPDMIKQGLNTSIIGRALENKLLSLETIDIRDFSEDKHKHVDDYPYGGGAGMVMAPGPVYRAYQYIEHIIFTSEQNKNECKLNHGCNPFSTNSDTIHDLTDVLENKNINQNPSIDVNPFSNMNRKKPRVIYLTPQGKVFNQSIAEELAKEEDLVFLCGHYEGIDERVLEMIVTDYISIGDYVLTGGELPTMVMIDAISRLVPGVLNNDVSAEFETFQDNLLEYPQYTRPEVFMDRSVPEVLLSGHHAKIDAWRKEQSIIRTAKNRPDLLKKAVLTKKEQKFLEEYLTNNKLDEKAN